MPQKYRRYPASSLQARLQTTKKTRPWWLIPLIVLTVISLVIIPVILITKSKNDPAVPNNSQTTEPSFDKTLYSLDDPASPWVVVNKQRPLTPKTYTPANLRVPSMVPKASKTSESMTLNDETAQALEVLFMAAQDESVDFKLVSGYRSYSTQKTIYDSEVKGFGQAVADQESARPGHSEHQTGWAVDLGRTDGECEIKACFADTPEGQWLATNAHKHGFVIRYAKDKTDITGYVYEPWHLRYVGVELAEEMHRIGIETLEEFFNLSPAPNY